MDWERISRADRLEGEGKVEEALREYQAILGEYSNAEDQPGDNAVVAMGEVR